MKSINNQRGVAAVEATIVTPIFFFLLITIIDGGRMIYAYNAVAHAAREGARYMVVRGQEAGQDSRRAGDAPASLNKIKAYILTRAQPLANIDITVTWKLDGNGQPNKAAGQPIEVHVAHEFDSVTPFLPSITLESRSTAVIYY